MKNFFSKLPASINSLNLRTRLILGNLIVTFLAVAGLGALAPAAGRDSDSTRSLLSPLACLPAAARSARRSLVASCLLDQRRPALREPAA